MAIDPTKPQAAVSTPQGNASLDEILASLEQQTGAHSTSTPSPMSTDKPNKDASAPVSEAITEPKLDESPATAMPEPKVEDNPIPSEAISPEPLSELKSESSTEPTLSENSIPSLSEVTPTPVASMPESLPDNNSVPNLSVQPSPLEELKSEPDPAAFAVDEKHIEAPVAMETVPSIVEDHDALKETSNTLTPPPLQPVSSSEPATPTPPPEQKSGGGFHLPKFAVAGLAVLIMLVGSVAAYIAIGKPFGSVDVRDQATGCTIQYDGSRSFKVFNCASSNQIEIFEGTSCPTTSTSLGKSSVVIGKEYIPTPPAGKCQQIDHHFGGVDPNGNPIGAGGVCACNTSSTPPPVKRACGEACATNADCRNPSTGGFPVECRNGTCQLPLTGPYACPEGQSEGSICSCSALQLCGQPCGPAVGNKLCSAGSKCGFITPSNACKVNGVDQTAKQYCLPLVPNNGYSLKRCDVNPPINYIAANTLVKPDGTQTNVTPTDVAAACAPPSTPTPTPTATPTPTPTVPPSNPPFVCLKITRDVASPKIGDQVRFTCGAVNVATRYEFRYKNTQNGAEGTLNPISTNSNRSEPLVITLTGKYRVQCRPCNGTSCTNWENW